MQRARLTMMMATVATLLFFSHAHADDAFSVAGQEIYESYCGACHGFDGVPLLPNTPNFSTGERMNKSDSELLDSIRAGKGTVMPGWLGILSDQQCESVLQFIRESLS